MATSDNILQAVQTYQESMLARLLNLNAFISKANTRFKDFQNLTANLGSTVTFDTPPRFVSNSGLVIGTFDSVAQEVKTLTVNNSRNVNFAFDAQQLVFNIDNSGYRTQFEKAAVAELGSYIEQDIASVIPSSTYRFYTSGVTGSGTFTPSAINSLQQLDQAIEDFKAYGAAPTDFEMFLPNRAMPAIVNGALAQFALNRNNELANSWEIGNINGCEWYRSNLLPLHTSGTTGNSQQLLTITAVTRQSDGGITSITFSGATNSDANAVKADDLFQFQPVTGQADVNYLTYTGHAKTGLPFQFRSVSNATANGSGVVTITVDPIIYDATAVSGNPLVARYQNTDVAVVAGMKVLGVPSHRCALLISGKPLFLAMPRLPDVSPYKTANSYDEQTGTSLRLYTGAGFGTNTYGTVLDCIWGKTLVKEYAMRLIFPTTV